MQRFCVYTLLMFAAAPCRGAGVFNGTSSDLSATVSSTAHEYPTILAAWVKFSSVDDDAVVSLSDGDAAGSNDSLQLRISGTSVSAVSTANGASSSSTQTGLVTSQWQFVVARFDSASSRRVRIGSGAWSTESTTTRSAANFDEVSIGSHHTNSVTGSFAGRIAGVTVIRGIDSGLLELTADQLAGGLPGSRLWHSLGDVYLWQPLHGEANGVYSVGSTLTATSVTLDSSDQPALVSRTNSVTAHLNVEYAEPIDRFLWLETTGEVLPEQRLAVLDSDEKLSLADASDAAWVGVTREGSILGPSQEVWLRGSGRQLEIESASGASWTPGTSIAYAAADGEVDDNGTVAVGIVTHVDGDTVRVLSY